MYVAHFVHRYPPALGGCESYVERLSRYLATKADSVSVWTSTAIKLEEMWLGRSESREAKNTVESRSSEFAASDVDVHRFPPLTFPGRRYLLKAASLIPYPPLQALTLPCNPVCPDMWRAAGSYSGPVDVVHAFAFPYSFVAACALRLARRREVPFLLTPFLHLGDPTNRADRTRRQYTSRPLRWLLRQADQVFVQTPSEASAVIQLGVPSSRVVLQGLGVDPTECTGGNRDAVRRAWGVAEDEVVVGHLANLSHEKGTVDLLHAAERERFRLVLAGPDMPSFRDAFQASPVKDRITHLGRLTVAQKQDFFTGIDVFALPSRTDSFGLVLLEAWANGKPNVCYRAGGPTDLIRDGIDGCLVPCGHIDALINTLAELAKDRSLRSRMGKAGQERVGREFRWEEKLELVRDAYRAGCAGRIVRSHRTKPDLPASLHT